MANSSPAILGSTLSRVLGSLKSERLITHNAVLGVGTVMAGGLGVAFQSLFSHQLQPADYGAVFAVISAITFLGLPATGFTLLMARETSRGRANGLEAPSASLLRHGNRALLASGVLMAVALVLSTPWLSRLFQVPETLWLAAAPGIPFGIALPLLLGEFQGEQRFAALAGLTSAQAALKLLAAVALGVFLGPVGVIGGISLATIAVYAFAVRLLQPKLALRPKVPWFRSAAAYMSVILPSTIALSVLLSSDVLLVKHYFASHDAGQYASVAALGRAIFWGASAVAAVLFPKLVFRAELGRGGAQLVVASLLFVILGGALAYAIFSFVSGWLVVAFAGSAYASASAYLGWYAVGMTVLGGATVLIATHQSRGTPAFLAVLLPLTIAEPVLIVLFHQSLLQVVQVLTVAMVLVSIGLAGLYFVQERRQVSKEASYESVGAYSPIQVNR